MCVGRNNNCLYNVPIKLCIKQVLSIKLLLKSINFNEGKQFTGNKDM